VSCVHLCNKKRVPPSREFRRFKFKIPRNLGTALSRTIHSIISSSAFILGQLSVPLFCTMGPPKAGMPRNKEEQTALKGNGDIRGYFKLPRGRPTKPKPKTGDQLEQQKRAPSTGPSVEPAKKKSKKRGDGQKQHINWKLSTNFSILKDKCLHHLETTC
jgi:hypothetical protein